MRIAELRYFESGEQTFSSEELVQVAESCYSESWYDQHSWLGVPTPFFHFVTRKK